MAALKYRAVMASTSAPVPFVRTSSIRSCQRSGGPRYGDVQQSTSELIRSGALTPSHMPTMPPSESPA